MIDQEKRNVHKFTKQPFVLFAPEKGTAMVVLSPNPGVDLNEFSGTRAKLVGIQDGVLMIETQKERIHLYNFELKFGKEQARPAMA